MKKLESGIRNELNVGIFQVFPDPYFMRDRVLELLLFNLESLSTPSL